MELVSRLISVFYVVFFGTILGFIVSKERKFHNQKKIPIVVNMLALNNP